VGSLFMRVLSQKTFKAVSLILHITNNYCSRRHSR
jgi:hypothetical protein